VKKKVTKSGKQVVSMEDVVGTFLADVATTVMVLQHLDPNEWYDHIAGHLSKLAATVEITGRALLQSHAALREIEVVLPPSVEIVNQGKLTIYLDENGDLLVSAPMELPEGFQAKEGAEGEVPF